MAYIKEHINDHTLEEDTSSSNEIMLRDILISRLRSSGIEVITSRAVGQRILDDYEQGIIKNKVKLQSAFHGSGISFDHFDTIHHLSEGEGNQTLCVGTYVSQVRKVAENYANIASLKGDRFTAVVDGVSLNYNAPRHVSDGIFLACDKLAKYGREEAINVLKQNISDYAQLGWSEKEAEAREALDYLNSHDIHIPERGRYLYTVDIPDDNGNNYLQWDSHLQKEDIEKIYNSFFKSPLSVSLMDEIHHKDFERRKAIEEDPSISNKRTALYYDKELMQLERKESQIQRILSITDNPDLYVEDFYQALTEFFESDVKASEFLSSIGYKGLKVHTDYYGFDPDRQRDWNYIVFDSSDIHIKDKIKFFKTSNGDAYGFTLNNKIYVDIDIANSETPIHEYAHLWASALRAGNEHEWNNVVALMKQQTDIWDSVKSRYPQLSSDDDIADEVLATYSGQRGAKLLREQMKGIMGENNTKSSSMFDAFEEAIKRFWHDVADMLHIHYTDSEQVADQIMSDMLNGVNPNEVKKEAFVRQEFESLVDSNKKFNERLSSLMEEPHQKDQRLRMGYASTFLREGGLADGMIFLQYNKILRKSSESYKNNHPFDIASLRNLPIAIAYPITVFEDTNNKKTGNTILTELSDGNHNFIVAVKTVNEHRANGVNMEINDITTLFPKDEKGIVNWYNTGKATNIDKKKALRFISSLQTHSGNEINSEELSSAANIINKFEKAKYQEDNFDKTFKEVSSDRRYVEAVASGHIEEARQMLAERAKSMGYLSTDYQGKDSWSAPVAEIEPTDFENKEVLQQMIDDFGREANVYGIINGIQGHDSDYYYNPDAVGFHGQAANETAEILRRLRDEHASGDTQVDVYRVVPNMVKGSQIMQGDWVALSKAYCEDLGKHKYGEGNYHVIESKAPIKNLWMGDEDMREFGFDDGQGDVEKNVLHNRKLLDITYDNQGQLIPLSQRYNERDDDIRFQLNKQNKDMGNSKDKISQGAQKAMEAFADHMVKVMEDMKRSDWKKGWSVGSNGMFGLPMNIKGFTYSGVNAMITSFHTLDNGYTVPVYMTFKQASKYGCHIKEGERSIPIINVGVDKYYNHKHITDEEYDQLTDEEKDKVFKQFHITSFSEFNIDQTNLKEVNKDLYDKLVSLFHGEAPSYDREGMFASQELDRMLKNQEWVCHIDCSHATDSAYYRASTDQIVIPMKEQFKISKTPDEIFKDGQEFYSTALHEMAHSTGHQSRLNRPIINSFGTKEYAKEELIAELTSALVCSALGFDKRINRNSAAYLDSWVRKLSSDPNYIREVMPQVNRASKMVLMNIDKQRVALGMQPLMRSGEIDLDTIQVKDSVKQQQEVVNNKEAQSLSRGAQHVGDTLDKDAIADGYANNLEKQWDEVVKMFGQDENLFDQLTAAASGQPLDSVKHTDKFDIVHDFINQFGGKKELGAETETTTGALYNSHSVAQLKLNDGSILEVNDYSKAFDDSVKDVQELSHVRDGAIIDSVRKEIGADNQNLNQETLNNLWSAFAGSAPMNRPQEQHLVDKQNDTAEGKNPNSGIEDNDKTKVISTGSYYATETDRSAVLALNDMLHDLRNGYEVFNHLNDYVKSRQEVSHRLKAGNISPIEPSMLMSHELMGNIDKDHLDKYVLVPVPSHTGKANLTLVLASAISTQTGIEVTDLLEGKEHEPFYGVKKYQGSNGLDPDKIDFGFKVKDGMQLPEGRVPILVDNVLDTGKTISDSAKVLGAKERLALVFANTDNWKEHPSYDIELAPSNTIRASKDSKSINDIVAQASRLVTVEDQDANNPLQQRSHLSQAAVAVNYLNHIRENKGYSWFHDEKNWNVPVRKDIYLESPAEHIKSVANQSKLDLENEVRSLIDKYYDENAPKELYYYDTWSDEKLLTYMKLDGGGDLNKADNVDVYEEFDARHSSDIMAIGERFMDQLVDNHTSLNDAKKQLDGLRHKDISLWATPERVELIGKEETLNDYITNYEKVLRTQQKEVNSNMEESDKPTVTVKATPAKEWYLSVNYLQSGEDVEIFSKMEKNEDYKGILESARNYDYSSENDWDYRDTFKSNPVHYNGDVFLDEDEDYAVVSNNSVGGTYSIFRKVTEADLRERLIEDGYGTEKIGDYDNRLSDDVKELINRMAEEKTQPKQQDLDNELHSESDNKQVAASNEEKAVVKPSVDNSEQSYYVEVASYMNSEDVQMFDEIKANESSLLTLARQCDPGDAIDQEYTYKTPYQGKGDKVIAEDDNYAVVFNDESGSNSYDVMRKVSESDIRLNIDRYGLSQAASDDFIEVAKKYEAEKIAQKVEAGEKQELVDNPIMKTFYQIKAEHPNNLLLFQSENGDFINSYEEDARKVSEILRLPLQESDTVKDRNGQFVDTCVFPKHALSTYLPKLVRAGEKVILVDNPVINRDESQDKQKTPHEDSDMRTDVTDTAKQIVASDNVPMEQAEKEAKEIADEQVHKEFHQQQDKLHAEDEKQQQVEKQEQEKKRQEQAKKQKVMNPKLYDVFGMKDGQRELVKEGLGIVAAATFVERNSERYQRKGYDYLISMPHVEETLEKSQLKEADMAKEQSPQEQEGKERKNPYQPLFEGTREEAKQIVDALKNDMENPDNTIPYDEILRDATLYGETPLYADKEWYKKYAEGKSDPEIAGLYRRALATLETIPEQQATVKSISDNTVESNQEQEDMNKKEEQLKQQAKKEEELHKEESSMSEPVTPKASSDDSVKEQTEQTKEPFSKEDEKVVNTAAVHAGLLLGALESAKEGIWLNPHGKHGAALLEPGKMITGYNRLMMDLCADKNHYKTNVFTYYDYAKKEEMPVKQGQTSLPIDWTRWDYENVATKEVITTEQYAELTPDKQQDYARHSTKQTRHLYNIDQTAMAGTKVADYSKLVKDNGSKFEDIPELPTDKNFLNLTNRLHGKHKDCTIILGEGDKNFAYGKHAEKVGSVMGVPVQSKDIDGKKVSYIEFPHTALDTVLPKMIGSHNKVALCSNVLESKFEASNNISKNSVRDAATVADKVSRKAGFTLERVLDDVPVSYDKEKDIITYSGNNARQPGRENLAAVEKANDIYRAVVEATGRENRLDRVARFNMLPEDNAKYEKLVQELSAGVLMASHGLPAIISKENRELIPYWEREIKENPKMMAVLEKDVNNSIEQIEKHLLGQEVDYAKVRGARPALFDAKDYTVASKMAQLPNAETKEFVVIRNADKTAADVILPEGAALPGMNKDRITHALAKENIKEVHFYNAGGAQGLYKDNDYFAGKTATLTKLKQWELLPRHVVDISSQYLNVEKKPLIERFRAIPDDSHRWAFNIKAKGEGQFSVYPAKEYLNAYFTARNNPNKVEKAKMMSSLAQRYYAVAQAHPEVKKELIMPKVPEGVDMSKLTGTTIGRDKDDHSKVFVQSTIDGAFHKEPITMAQYQRMWLADDMQDYKNAIAANAFASIIKSAKAQQEADEGLKIVDNSNVKDVVGHSEKQDQGHSESHSDGGSSDSDDKSESEGQGVGDASSKQADKDKSEEENKSRGFHM